mmetsp:Transcript_41229/g.119407  ORF Transcript_41229/g.119407 Transcript_41229/m.119407 type:complete len:238 (-) Transcript_41229:124-837(-)
MPSAEAMRGLMSHSMISGWFMMRTLKRTMMSINASMSTPFMPRTPCKAVNTFVRCNIFFAKLALRGGKPKAESLNTSTSEPPMPNRITGPSCTSIDEPRMISIPFRLIMGCTVAPSKPSGLARRETLSFISVKAFSTSRRVCKLSFTPPTSNLWVMVVELSFTTTGKPMRSAAAPASSGVAHTSQAVTGMPYTRSSCLLSASVSRLRPVPRIFAIISDTSSLAARRLAKSICKLIRS